jgi:mevalonate kinase
MEKITTWFSNGNLIITGEYFVMTGAKALAVPLKSGQRMTVELIENQKDAIIWKSYENGISWFEANIGCKNLDIRSSSDTETAIRLKNILKKILQLRPDFLSENLSYNISSEIDFSLNWGWGSSSSLISNLANWAGIDPFALHKLVSQGSGYDIAASLSSSPLFYQLRNGTREIKSSSFNPRFKNFIHFIWLGRKQNSETSIGEKLHSVKVNNDHLTTITKLTEMIAGEEDITEFTRLVAEHEKILAGVLQMTRIKEKYFNGFEGEIKSLGAWGGDFAMVVSPLRKTDIIRYFKGKGLETLFGFDEIVKLN